MDVPEIVVVASHRRPPLVTEYLIGLQLPHRVSYTPDYDLPADFKPAFPFDNPVGAYRCFRGHQLALSLSTEPIVLVLEDDAVPADYRWMEQVVEAAQLLTRFPVVSLHARDVSPAKIVARQGERFFVVPGIQKHKDDKHAWALGSLAYLVTQRQAGEIVADAYDGTPYDLYLHSKRCCICEPSPFRHDRRHGSLVEDKHEH